MEGVIKRKPVIIVQKPLLNQSSIKIIHPTASQRSVGAIRVHVAHPARVGITAKHLVSHPYSRAYNLAETNIHIIHIPYIARVFHLHLRYSSRVQYSIKINVPLLLLVHFEFGSRFGCQGCAHS